MFEFMYAKKVDKDMVMKIIDKYKDDYHLFVTQKPNGTLEIYIGGKRIESEE